jgi:hypothetical protein
MTIPETIQTSLLSLTVALLGWIAKKFLGYDRRLSLIEYHLGLRTDTEVRKKPKVNVLPLLLLLLPALAGCGPMQRAFFTTNQVPVVTTNGAGAVATNSVPLISPAPAIQDSVGSLQYVGGPYGVVIGQLLLAGLSVFTWFHNRRALAAHIEHTKKP